jgi:tetrahydromethanopterin S-methyltransferase subunit G
MFIALQQTPGAAQPQQPQAPIPQVLGPTADVPALQGQLTELRIQQVSLRAQWNGLRNQLDAMLQTNPARPGVAQQWANVGEQLAQVDGQIAMLDARLAQKQGRVVGSAGQQVPRPVRILLGDRLGDITFIAVVAIVAVVFTRVWRMSVWRGRSQRHDTRIDELAPRLDRLEHAVDTIAIEIERISEGQRFVTKILAERPAQGAAGANQPQALGAGSAEPVNVQDKQGVRQVITSR